ncbi:hypothetical protein FEM48_Zijuj01G0192600 [Ziziphus jujuba var. spinosa]|uniref:Phytocyanin domain-containing protein n=1 Tax=Ziziphus jujuba var. spinosa TaxID=714518 RepID=A0A978W328_ZIZJJ|nr:cucumber peeling cupredoxin-like [Ziziphus jujuba var. spinosa]KAH7546362.1 hypothetical protein FEM48_Zijuj01G0192600 [Ziziphus jujuba var. spinosa]
MAKQMGLMGLGCFIFMMVALQINGASATTYVVGDSLGWTVPPNTSFYTEWSSSKTFDIGDEVLFNWTGNHNVAEVSSLAEYENCANPGIVIGSAVTVNPLENGSRFFICTVDDHCEAGQKVIITVGSPTNTSSTASPAPSPSSASSLSFGVIFTVLTSVVAYFFA